MSSLDVLPNYFVIYFFVYIRQYLLFIILFISAATLGEFILVVAIYGLGSISCDVHAYMTQIQVQYVSMLCPFFSFLTTKGA